MKRLIVLGAFLMVSLALVGSATAASAPTIEIVSSDVVFGHDHWLGWFDDGSGSLLKLRPPDVCDWHGCLTG